MHLSVDASLLAVSEMTMIAALSFEDIVACILLRSMARSVVRSSCRQKAVVLFVPDPLWGRRGAPANESGNRECSVVTKQAN
jgi:hypothetical protein